MYRYIFILLLTASQWPLVGQVDSSQITIDRWLLQGHFVSDHFGPHQWLSVGEFYTTIERNSSGENEIIRYDSRTGERSILVNARSLTPDGSNAPLSIHDYKWSADEGKLLIFTNSRRVWRTNTRGDYWILDLEKGTLSQLGGNLPESSLMFAKFSPDGSRIAYVSGNNIYLDTSDHAVTQLTEDGTEDIINGTFDWAYEEEFFCKDGFRWSPDGSHIAFWQVDASGIKDFLMINNTDSIYPFTIPVQYPKVGETPSSAKVGIIEMSTGQRTWIDFLGDPHQYYIPRMQWMGTGDDILITRLNRKQNHLRLWHYDVATEKTRAIYEEKSETWVDLLHIDISSAWAMEDVYQLDGGSSFLWTSEKDGWRHLWNISMDGSRPPVLVTPGEYDIASVKGIGSNEVYFIASPGNPTERYLFKANVKEPGDPIRITPANYAGVNRYDVSPNGLYAIHDHSAASSPNKANAVVLFDHSISKVLYDNAALEKTLDALDMPEVEFFQVTTESGVTMDGKIIKPSSFDESKKYPVVFYVYGEPAGQTASATMGNMWHFLLAQNGYLVITMDNRGTPSLKGNQWRKSIYRQLGRVNAQDQAEAAMQVIEWPFVDNERIAVWGWSGGGAMTLNLMFKYPEIYKTGIAVAAVTNQLLYDNIYQERYMGLPQENRNDFLVGSPAEHAKGLEGNLLYIHGTADDNVHYQNAEVLIDALIRHNKIFDLMIYPNRSHGIYERANTSRHLYTTMTNYLKKHVEPGGK